MPVTVVELVLDFHLEVPVERATDHGDAVKKLLSVPGRDNQYVPVVQGEEVRTLPHRARPDWREAMLIPNQKRMQVFPRAKVIRSVQQGCTALSLEARAHEL